MTIPGLALLLVGLLPLTTGCTDRGPKGSSAAVQGGILASAETDPVPHDGDAADDPFLSEQRQGIWRYDAEPDARGPGALVDETHDAGHLSADVEGLTIAYVAPGSGFLIASSQGDSTFRVYRRETPNDYLGAFRIQPGGEVDGVEHTDGIDVTTTGLHAGFTDGVFVAQDGRNRGGNQNFKLVPWSRIARALPGPAHALTRAGSSQPSK
jgi:myo-inositol-hexaphosphate 3-phosphohydrolase